MELLPGKDNLRWTQHSMVKMRQYRLTESRVKRILRHPKRLEVGVAPDTVAGMQSAGSKKHPYEIWVMWATKKLKSAKTKSKIRFINDVQTIVISAWRYPGVSPLREPPPIPDDVWEVIRKLSK